VFYDDDYEDCCLLYLRLCSLVDCYQGFRGTCYVHQVRW